MRSSYLNNFEDKFEDENTAYRIKFLQVAMLEMESLVVHWHKNLSQAQTHMRVVK